jgi:hypothetical protein
MSSIAWPAGLEPRTCRFVPFVNQRVHASNYQGSEQAVDWLNDRWLCTLELPGRRPDKGAELEAFLGRLRGMVNTTPLFNFRRRVPTGTMRGSPVLAAGAAQGAASLSITGTGTLKAGDMLGCGGLLLMVAENCQDVAGTITVPLVNRIRTALAIGAAVTWNAPTAPFRLMENPGVLYVPGRWSEPMTLEFREYIA